MKLAFFIGKMNIWEKLKNIIAKLLGWFRRKPPMQPQPSVNLAEENKPIKANRVRFRLPNMPKRQPCPNGHGLKKRSHKTVSGAHYHCNKCGDFFVQAVR